MRSLKTNRVVAGIVLVLIAVAAIMVQTSGDSAVRTGLRSAPSEAVSVSTAGWPSIC
jgi:hypothetical protein